MTEPLDLLAYWRASLADGQLPPFPDKVATREVDWEAIRGGRLPPDTAKALVGDWKASGGGRGSGKRGKEKDEPVVVPVLIAPFVLIARHRHGTSGRRSDKPYAPLIIPAQMAADGRLSFDPARHLPWMARTALEPSAAPEPQLGTLEDFDGYRSTTPRPEEAEWSKLVDYAEGLCHAVTGRSLADVGVDAYDRGPGMVVAAFPPSSPSRHLLTLADALPQDEARLPPTFSAICRSGPMRTPLAGDALWAASARHLGQMGADYPLAARQRDAVRHLLSCDDGDILPVNGPPGTGKTTLLQSIVATMVVEAALAGGEPPVIAVTSTNNQAVTNVIDSFAKVKPAAHRADDPFEGRWLPGVKSFALFLPAGSKEVDEDKYHVARLPDGGAHLSGMPAEMLRPDAVAEGETGFLAKAGSAFGKDFGAVAAVRRELEVRLAAGAADLARHIDAIHSVLSRRAARPEHSAQSFSAQVVAEAAKEEERAEAAESAVAAAQAEAAAARAAWKKADGAVSLGLEELYPAGGVVALLLGWLLGLLPPVRAGRWTRCRRIIRQAGIEDGPFASLVVPTNLDAVRVHLDAALAGFRRRADALDDKAREIARESGETRQAARARLAALEAEAQAWRDAEERWLSMADALCAATAEVKTIPQQEVIDRPALAEALLDVTLRHDLFLLAAHYWEARWLEAARTLVDEKDDPVKALSGKLAGRTRQRWRMMACLTPCFVSTLFMLPKHLQFFDPESDNKNPHMTDLIDLLIVDEAGQVPPEIGCLGLSLGRKALVVGDIHQIEPVWSVGPSIDEGNITRYGLRGQDIPLEEVGVRASSGSLMRVARHASVFAGAEEGDPGIFLTEHRRCQAPIVAICNELVYRDRLVPCSPTLSDPILPPLGWANVRSMSQRRGSSRFNLGEAESIAEWLSHRRTEIETRYGKPLHQAVGIVTPFSAQKDAIRAILARHGIEESLTVGTVHALQGAERGIVLFSPVHTAEDGGQPFFDRGPNMINVAVSRAQDSFLVFGDMRIFDAARAKGKVPSGVLAKHLFARADYEITDALNCPAFVAETSAPHTVRLDSLVAHQAALREALERAGRRVLVVSPYLSADAIARDGIEALVTGARGRNVTVIVAFDPEQNKVAGRLKPACAEAVDRLARAGADVVERARIHNKTLAVDDGWIVEGSFNWLSAARDDRYSRQERSLRYHGPDAAEFVKAAWSEVGALSGHS